MFLLKQYGQPIQILDGGNYFRKLYTNSMNSGCFAAINDFNVERSSISLYLRIEPVPWIQANDINSLLEPYMIRTPYVVTSNQNRATNSCPE